MGRAGDSGAKFLLPLFFSDRFDLEGFMDRRTFLSLGAAAVGGPLLDQAAAFANTVPPLISHGGVAKTHVVANDMFWHWRRCNPFTIGLHVTQPTRLRLHFNACLRLTDKMSRMSVAAVRACLRGPQAGNDWSAFDNPFHQMPPEIPGCFWRENILPNLVTWPSGSTDRHKYAVAGFSTVHEIAAPGFYRVEIWSRARSSEFPGPYTDPVTGSEVPSADGNVRFDFEPYDAFAGSAPQNQLVCEMD